MNRGLSVNTNNATLGCMLQALSGGCCASASLHATCTSFLQPSQASPASSATSCGIDQNQLMVSALHQFSGLDKTSDSSVPPVPGLPSSEQLNKVYRVLYEDVRFQHPLIRCNFDGNLQTVFNILCVLNLPSSK